MGRRRTKPAIADNPLSKNLAWLLRHPDSGHPGRHSVKGFKLICDNIHKAIIRLYPDDKTNLITAYCIEHWLTGFRQPLFSSITKFCEGYNAVFPDEESINPYDLYVDRDKWVRRIGYKKPKSEPLQYAPL